MTEYDGGGSPHLWEKAPTAWRCSACYRSKSEMLRPSKNKNRNWSGKISSHTEYIFDGVSEDETWIDHHEYHLICYDCASIAASVKQRCSRLSDDRVALQLSDMRAAAQAAPNAPHTVDFTKAIELVEQNLMWSKLREDYNGRLLYVSSLQSEFRALTKYYKGDQVTALNRMVRDCVIAQSWTQSKAREHLEYNLEEAERLLIDKDTYQ